MGESDYSAVVGSRVLQAETLPDEAERRRLIEIAETRGLEVFAAAELERVEGGNGLLVFVPDGSLWVQGMRHHVDLLGRDQVRVVYEGDPLTPRFLIPANRGGADNAPATIGAWNERQARRAATVEKKQQEAATKREALRRIAEPVTFDDLASDGAKLTLRQAGEAVERVGGTIRVEGGRLAVALPPAARLTIGLPSVASKAARRLYAAEAEVLAAAPKRGGYIAAAKLPDRAILPSGRLAP